jgi:hypothetical protein
MGLMSQDSTIDSSKSPRLGDVMMAAGCLKKRGNIRQSTPVKKKLLFLHLGGKNSWRNTLCHQSIWNYFIKSNNNEPKPTWPKEEKSSPALCGCFGRIIIVIITHLWQKKETTSTEKGKKVIYLMSGDSCAIKKGKETKKRNKQTSEHTKKINSADLVPNTG